MKQRNVPGSAVRRGRRIAGHAQAAERTDPYRLPGKLSEPAACPQCAAVYHDGRWQWLPRPPGAHEVLCQACHRVNDRLPAGVLTLRGPRLPAHRSEIESIARKLEQAERQEHPLNRIMAIEETADELTITTTDIHLPRRIGEAVHRALRGALSLHYGEGEYSLRATWTGE